jgi:hypothetical protein
MLIMAAEPNTLQEAAYTSDPANCREYLVVRRWPNGVTCPTCGSKNVSFKEKYNPLVLPLNVRSIDWQGGILRGNRD